MPQLSGWQQSSRHQLAVSLTISVLLHAGIVSSINGRYGASSPTAAMVVPAAALLQITFLNTRVTVSSGRQFDSVSSSQSSSEMRKFIATESVRLNKVEKHPVPDEIKTDDSKNAPTTVEALASNNRVNASKDELEFDAGYLKQSVIDTAPFPLEEIAPEYPESAGILEGYVILKLLIGKEGAVDSLEILDSYPKGLFDASAKTAFTNKLFSPGILQGMPVKTQMVVKVRFSPEVRDSSLHTHGYNPK